MPSIPVKPVGLSITVMFDIERFILSGNGGTDPTGPCCSCALTTGRDTANKIMNNAEIVKLLIFCTIVFL